MVHSDVERGMTGAVSEGDLRHCARAYSDTEGRGRGYHTRSTKEKRSPRGGAHTGSSSHCAGPRGLALGALLGASSLLGTLALFRAVPSGRVELHSEAMVNRAQQQQVQQHPNVALHPGVSRVLHLTLAGTDRKARFGLASDISWDGFLWGVRDRLHIASVARVETGTGLAIRSLEDLMHRDQIVVYSNEPLTGARPLQSRGPHAEAAYDDAAPQAVSVAEASAQGADATATAAAQEAQRAEVAAALQAEKDQAVAAEAAMAARNAAEAAEAAEAAKAAEQEAAREAEVEATRRVAAAEAEAARAAQEQVAAEAEAEAERARASGKAEEARGLEAQAPHADEVVAIAAIGDATEVAAPSDSGSGARSPAAVLRAVASDAEAGGAESWGTEEVVRFFGEVLRLPQYVDALRSNEVTGAMLLDLIDDTHALDELGITSRLHVSKVRTTLRSHSTVRT